MSGQWISIERPPCGRAFRGERGVSSAARVDIQPEGVLVRVADRLRVLGQVVRLRLVEQLRAGEATPQELADTLGLTQQNVSKHLQVLHRSGVVARRPDGANESGISATGCRGTRLLPQRKDLQRQPF
jgi:DNA-binding transcriptional ArsR family regulator